MAGFSVYVVSCRTPDHFYIGYSTDLSNTIKYYANGDGPVFLRQHGYKELIRFEGVENEQQANERVKDLTTEYMKKYGMDNAAGGPWSQVHKPVVPTALRREGEPIHRIHEASENVALPAEEPHTIKTSQVVPVTAENTDSDSIIDSLRSFCSHIDTEREGLHPFVLQELDDYFSSQGFTTYREYPTTFSSIRRRDRILSRRQGFIDLLVEKNNLRVGIEFDNGDCLRYRNIEKLLQSNLGIAIGIVRTSISIPENISRIKLTMKERNTSNEIWLLSLQNGFCDKVTERDLPGPSPGKTWRNSPSPFNRVEERVISDYLISKKIAFQYGLFTGENTVFAIPDFYLPAYNVYIEYWAWIDHPDPAKRSEYVGRMHRKMDAYHRLNMRFVSLIPSDIDNLNIILPEKFKVITGKALL